MIDRVVFLSPLRKQRRIVHMRHDRRIGATTTVAHASNGRELQAAGCDITGTLRIYLCRGWGRIDDVGDILRGLVASHHAVILDEWGRPIREYAQRPCLLPVAANADDIRRIIRNEHTA